MSSGGSTRRASTTEAEAKVTIPSTAVRREDYETGYEEVMVYLPLVHVLLLLLLLQERREDATGGVARGKSGAINSWLHFTHN